MPATVTTYSPQCTSCGTAIGHVAPIYARIALIRREENIKKRGFRPKDLASYPNDLSMGDVLDSLGVENMCCRVAIMGHRT